MFDKARYLLAKKLNLPDDRQFVAAQRWFDTLNQRSELAVSILLKHKADILTRALQQARKSPDKRQFTVFHIMPPALWWRMARYRKTMDGAIMAHVEWEEGTTSIEYVRSSLTVCTARFVRTD